MGGDRRWVKSYLLIKPTSVLKPLFLRASIYLLLLSLKIFSFADSLHILKFTAFGTCLIMFSGFKEDFRYLKEDITNKITKENNNYDQKNKNRKRKIIWFNPPFYKLANIDVGKYFLRLIDKHFKQDNILHKIFNRKTLKISYSRTKNISQIIKS